MLRARQTRLIVSKVIGFMSESAFVCNNLDDYDEVGESGGGWVLKGD
jgi:hypothetical protein